MRRLLEKLRILGRPDVVLDLHIYGGLLVATAALWQITRWEVATVFAGCWLAALGLWSTRPRKGP